MMEINSKAKQVLARDHYTAVIDLNDNVLVFGSNESG
jgi:hypothetical protein